MPYLPVVYKDFQKQFPRIARAYDELAQSCTKQGPLNKKCQRLIKLGIALLATLLKRGKFGRKG